MKIAWRGARTSPLVLGAVIVVVFCIGGLSGYFLNRHVNPAISITAVRDPINGYDLINPVLYTEVPESLSYPKYTSLKNALTQYVKTVEANGTASQISIYYRDMNASQWIGVNVNDTYNPASMLKVVTLIGVLQASESNPHLLSDRIAVPASVAIPTAGPEAYYTPVNPVQSGNTYSIDDLMQRMIVQSDNGANALLTSFLGDAVTNANYANLHIPLPKEGTVADITPQQYSHLFRILYNSSYLNTADSEKALDLLSQTAFTEGLVAGVPASTTVAHKFGEELYPSPNLSGSATTIPGLNDCGIIYYPNHPYFLCVMTKGTDFPTLANVIKDISRITWQQVEEVYPSK